MKLSAKIKLSFLVLIIFPIMMIFFFMLALNKYHTEIIEEKYNIDMEASKIMDSTLLFDKVTESYRTELKELINEKKYSENDKAFFDEINSDYSDAFTYIIVYYEDEFIYNGRPDGSEDISDNLPVYDHVKDVSVSTYYVGTGRKYIVKPVIFYSEDDTMGTIYIVCETGNILPEVKLFVKEFIIIAILIIVFTGASLTIWLYKSILRPVNKLKNAAQNIKDGNLDFSIECSENDEFGDFCRVFEDMRVHLKNSIEYSLQYDAESKELISNISHDLKTPITAIKGYMEGIMDGVADTPEKMERYIKTVYNKANDMDKLIGELTVYSKIDTNAIPYHFIKLNVSDYFEDCIAEISTELENKNFKLSYFNYTNKDTEVVADPEQLKRVINNLISNSIKYNDKTDGVINVRIKDQEDYVHFEFEDNGKGVGPSELPCIFERFYRGDTSRNSKNGGSGIGLSIVKKIVEAHGGTIWAFSTLNTGLSIHFILQKAGISVSEEKIKEEDVKEKKRTRLNIKKNTNGGRRSGR